MTAHPGGVVDVFESHVSAAILLNACDSDDADSETTGAASVSSTARFSSAQEVVTELNRLSAAGAIRCKHLAPMVFAETPFQRSWVAFLALVARAEDLHDAVDERYGEPLDGQRGDVRINLSFHDAFLVTEDDQRAEVAVQSSDISIKKIMLVKVGPQWWISGYTWEHAMPADKQAELPRRALSFQVEAEIAPALAARIRAGEFSTIADARAAHRNALLDYFESHPEIYQQITGKGFRRP